MTRSEPKRIDVDQPVGTLSGRKGVDLQRQISEASPVADTHDCSPLKGARPDLPPLAIDAAFRRPEREDTTERDQGSLLTAGLDIPAAAAPTRGKRTRRDCRRLQRTGGKRRGRPTRLRGGLKRA
jgi:hypothetical protein